MTTSIGLQELLAQLRDELTQETPDSPKLFFIDGVESNYTWMSSVRPKGESRSLSYSSAAWRGEAGVARERGHKITLKLRPLITYEEARAVTQGRAGLW